MAEAAAAEQKSGPSLIIQIAVLLVLSAAVGATGWFTGQFLGNIGREAQGTGSEVNADHSHKDEDGADKHEAALNIYRLETITTNLADPQDVWARLELALVFQDQPDPQIAEMVHQDFLAYLRTVKVRQIEGPSGFQHLRTDLDERASIRSGGAVKQVLIRTLLFE